MRNPSMCLVKPHDQYFLSYFPFIVSNWPKIQVTQTVVSKKKKNSKKKNSKKKLKKKIQIIVSLTEKENFKGKIEKKNWKTIQNRNWKKNFRKKKFQKKSVSLSTTFNLHKKN